jgi:hypothetical protein
MAESIEANPEAMIVNYRDVISREDAATDDLARAEWQGEDLLHEMAFGDPEAMNNLRLLAVAIVPAAASF